MRVNEIERYPADSDNNDIQANRESMVSEAETRTKAADIKSNRVHLIVFDIDDTLFHTTAKINVIKPDGTKLSLTNQQYNNYVSEPGDKFDFEEFKDAEKFSRESDPIRPMIAKLKAILNNSRTSKIIMLTARSDFDDRDKFLETFARYGIDMSRVHVHRAGNLNHPNSPAEKKAVFIRNYLNTNKYDRVTMYDDSMKNLRVFSELKSEYPNVQFSPYFVDHHGRIKLIRESMVSEAETRTKAAKEINKTFKESGYKKLGSGAEATVWAKDEHSVIKIIMPEDRSSMDSAVRTFKKFYEFCIKNAEQSNLPRFVQVTKNGHVETFTAANREFTMIGMERLKPLKEGSFSQALIWMMSDLVTHGKRWNEAHKLMTKPSTWKHWDGPPTVKELVAKIKNLDDLTYAKFDVLYTLMLLLYKRGKLDKVGWDLHTENVMQRSDGTLVIVDPWFASEMKD
jgi:hypothetical protein